MSAIDFPFGYNISNESRTTTMAQRGKQFKKLPFLKADDLPEKGQIEMKIIGNTRTHDGDYGFKLNMDVKIKEKQYTFGIKPTNPGLRVLIDSLAQRKAIKVERQDYNGNEYVSICGVEQRN